MDCMVTNISVMCEVRNRPLSSQCSGKIALTSDQNSNHKLLFCSKLLGLTLVLFRYIQSVITVPLILRYTVWSYSKGETLSGDQSGPWSRAIEQQLYLVRHDNGSREGRIQFNYTRLLCDVRRMLGEQVFICPRKISSVFFNCLI